MAGFRWKLLVAMMLVVSVVTALALYLAQRNLAANAEHDLQRQFQAELDALHHAQEIRHAALVERCRALVRRPRIHAALEEDSALDLLYPSAEDELHDLRESEDRTSYALHARFYRFLDRKGAVIPPAGARNAGQLRPEDEQRLAMPQVPDQPQLGYLDAGAADGTTGGLSEIIAILGIVNTLALSVYERTRELGLLRVVGMSRRQMRRMVRWESVVIAVLGGIVGLALGMLWGWAFARALEEQGITLFRIPWVEVLVFVAGSMLAGVLAAVFPAWRASRRVVTRR